MRILVTGASGFIGRHVIIKLLSIGHEVVATSTQKTKVEDQEWFKDVIFVEHTIGENTSEENLFEKFHQPDILVHLAWQGLPDYKSTLHFEVYLFHHYSFIKNLITNGLKDVSVTGTCFEYGKKNGCLNEEIFPEPVTPYALAKNTLRHFLEELRKKHEFAFKWVRLFYMYGSGQNPRSLLAQLDTAIEKGEETFNMSGGEQVRDYLPVEEVASGIIAIATQKVVTGIINCCSNQPIKIKELVAAHLLKRNKIIKLNLGYYPYTDFEPMEFWGNNSKYKLIK